MSAGHAPIIANPEYAEYLRRFGEIGCKAISSSRIMKCMRQPIIINSERS
jgi:phenylalanine-4-hydroxylase